jgi:K+ transporter
MATARPPGRRHRAALAVTALGVAKWRKLPFGFMARNARSATESFSIPPDRVVELGAQIKF